MFEMLQKFTRLLLLIASSLLSACQGGGGQPLAANQAWLKHGAAITLPGIQEEEPYFSIQQLLTASYGHETQSLMTLLDVDEGGIRLAGVSILGVRLFKLVYDGTGVHVQELAMLGNMPAPSQILLDIMLAYWPVQAWENALPEGWYLLDQGNSRHLYDEHGKAVYQISYDVNSDSSERRTPVRIEQFVLGYSIQIQTIGGVP